MTHLHWLGMGYGIWEQLVVAVEEAVTGGWEMGIVDWVAA